jgi:hypothetical protein
MKLVTHPAQTRALFVGIVDGSGWWVPHPHPGGVYARAGARWRARARVHKEEVKEDVLR